MVTAGIVSEFDPFHNGHKYLVEKTRENGATHIMTVMSGSFLQRGECAVLGKYPRAKAAVLGGVDLVLELPQIYACSSAQRFASGAVNTLAACGCVDRLSFGSECGDKNALMRAADTLSRLDVSEYTSQGFSYPRAAQAAAEKSGDADIVPIFSSPNDTLAAEYIRAAKGRLNIFAVKRTAPHNGGSEGVFISAMAIRRMMMQNDNTYLKYIPESTADIILQETKNGGCPAALENNERGVLTVLRRMTAEDFAKLPDVSEGLENRITRAVRENDTLEGIISAVKCKRYTRARICRVIACAYLGITAEMPDMPPQYIRVLAFNDKGAEVLKAMKKTARLPILTVARDFGRLNDSAAKMLAADIRATELFGLCTPTLQGCGTDHYTGAIYIDKQGG